MNRRQAERFIANCAELAWPIWNELEAPDTRVSDAIDCALAVDLDHSDRLSADAYRAAQSARTAAGASAAMLAGLSAEILTRRDFAPLVDEASVYYKKAFRLYEQARRRAELACIADGV